MPTEVQWKELKHWNEDRWWREDWDDTRPCDVRDEIEFMSFLDPLDFIGDDDGQVGPDSASL
jgi:hypothetical protein